VSVLNATPPFQEPIAEFRDDRGRWQKARVTDPWAGFLTELVQALGLSTGRAGANASLSDQSASIGSTDLASGALLGAGLYRVSYYARITTPATVSSSLQVSYSWTDGGVTLVSTGAAMTGNTTATVQQGGGLIYSDGASPITYSATYASVGATAMKYRLAVTVERVSV
jgi:hypothetical protein